jgi:2-methylcitrate dehydratase PrpD
VQVTRRLAELALGYKLEELPAEVRDMGALCILDGVACVLAGRTEPAVRIVEQEALDAGGREQASVIGLDALLPVAQAALVNGTAAHALDYDDVNLAIPGHATAVVMPAVMATAEAEGAHGRELLAAFIAGYEVACRVGALLGPGHYDRGFHATATAGVVGATAGCARLLRLDQSSTASALSLAATQASGLKALFANMGKPLHAGLAARNAVVAARLAAGGFDAGSDALEHSQGLANATSPNPDARAALADPDRFHILRNLFKYHAACYGTHAAIECARSLRSRGAMNGEAERVVLTVNPASDKYCNIASPRTSNEAKFSLRLTTALGLLGRDTSRLDAYEPSRVLDPEVVALRDRIEVRFSEALPMMQAGMELRLRSGANHHESIDAGVPETDRARQRERVMAKFEALVEPLLGAQRAEELRTRLLCVEAEPSVAGLLQAAAR